MENFTSVLGLVGATLVVYAYFTSQLGTLDLRSIKYNTINLTGASLLLFSLCFDFNLGSFFIELFWIAASLLGLHKCLTR